MRTGPRRRISCELQTVHNEDFFSKAANSSMYLTDTSVQDKQAAGPTIVSMNRPVSGLWDHKEHKWVMNSRWCFGAKGPQCCGYYYNHLSCETIDSPEELRLLMWLTHHASSSSSSSSSSSALCEALTGHQVTNEVIKQAQIMFISLAELHHGNNSLTGVLEPHRLQH